MPAQIHIVSGPSCCGKSVYISRHLTANEIVVFPRNISTLNPSKNELYIFHYNLLKPYSYVSQLFVSKQFIANPLRFLKMRQAIRDNRPFDSEPSIKKLIQFKADIHADVLIVPRKVLEARIAKRKTQEILVSDQKENYKNEKFKIILKSVSLNTLYLSWLSFLENSNIQYKLIDSLDDNYKIIDTKKEMVDYLNEY